jgi:hypothetical protein
MEPSLPVPSAAIVSCHLERPLDDEVWTRFTRLQQRRPGGFAIAALIRPPHDGEDRARWLDRARQVAARGPLGHHTHWTSPTHARPTGGKPAERVREEAEWLRSEGIAPTLFCGGGWYMDEPVAEIVAGLGYTDCTVRRGEPCRVRLASGALLPELPTTHSIGALVRQRLGRYVHAYFHDYDLLDPRRRLALELGLRMLGARRAAGPFAADGPEVEFSEAFAR